MGPSTQGVSLARIRDSNVMPDLDVLGEINDTKISGCSDGRRYPQKVESQTIQ